MTTTKNATLKTADLTFSKTWNQHVIDTTGEATNATQLPQFPELVEWNGVSTMMTVEGKTGCKVFSLIPNETPTGTELHHTEVIKGRVRYFWLFQMIGGAPAGYNGIRVFFDPSSIESRVNRTNNTKPHQHGINCGCSHHQQPEVEEQPAPIIREKRTLRHNGETIETTMTDAEIVEAYAKTTGGFNAFLVFRMAQEVERQNLKDQRLDSALEKIGHMFLYAIGHGLKRPRITVAYRNVRFQMYLSKRGNLCFKAADKKPGTDNKWGESRYIGCIFKGEFLLAPNPWNRNQKRNLTEVEADFIEQLKREDLAGFLAECSKDLGCCCYCNKPLTDERSKLVGYGEICARRWGLGWGNPEYMEKAPNFFDAYRNHAVIRAGFRTIAAEPGIELHWSIVSDYLEEQGLPRMEMPKKGSVTMPNI
jgi:hypothetical protein